MKWSRLALLIFLFTIFSPLASIVAQESTPELKPVPILDETFTSKDGRIHISYPKNLAQASNENAASEPGVRFYLATNQDIFKSFGDGSKTFSSGDVLIAVDVHERYWVHYLDDQFDRTLDVFALRQNLDDAGSDRTELTTVTVNGQLAVETYFKRRGYADGYDLLIDLGDGLLAQVYAYAPPGELSRWNALVQAIVKSITYKPYTEADLTETYTSSDGKVSVGYSKGWEVSKSLDMGLLSVVVQGDNVDFDVMVSKPETKGVTFQSMIDALAENLQQTPYTVKERFGKMDLTINSHPAQMMAIPYSDRPNIRSMLSIDLGDGVFAFIDGSVDKTRFERWQHTALVIAGTITYTP